MSACVILSQSKNHKLLFFVMLSCTTDMDQFMQLHKIHKRAHRNTK